GRTPLALGLMKGIELLRQALKRDPEIVPVMVVITDGKANVGLQQGASIQDILAESRQVGGGVPAAGIHSLVLDTEQGFVKLHQARELASAMQAQYVQLEQLEGSHITAAIRDSLRI
ncbi:magnesium chelatase, partial [Paenibacillus sepulcri]|nr:magnesium chelatase [Paenibacillus sepulcri]